MSALERRERRRARRMRRRQLPREERRAIYLLPNLFTTTSLLLGFWSIVQSSKGLFEQAALGIVLAGVFDMLDGRIARATRTTSRFGREYDSIADAISFGVAPAFLAYSWTLAPLGPRGWLVAALFAICAALRLARFNVQSPPGSGYQGLPSTFAGGFVAVSVWFLEWAGVSPPLVGGLGLFVTAGFAGLALLMVSSVPYPSLGRIRLAGRHPFQVIAAAAVAWVLILLHHEPVFFALGFAYLVSGPWTWLRARSRASRPEIQTAEPQNPETAAPTEAPRESPTDGP